ncbi:MAG TPA: cob(I)yrinic acid a,c-diamide adenosyltransferase [Burkholderiales bacterium]|jgi:cob(I)alamin adenosyltransferase|nr:cob(I)yrinic acid a,c-diamide adenosyltransferase [Burkholderiales bacterium]
MGHRLSKITTRTGDAGETGLGDGSRVSKAAARVQALGDIDELNSSLGVLLAEALPGAVDAQLREALLEVQQALFDLGGEVSIPGHALLADAAVERLERCIERWNGALPPLEEFILPGGTRAAAAAHLARTVCRRAERSLVALGEKEHVGAPARRYLNRLSDLLFVAGRLLNQAAGHGDVQWRHARSKKKDT